MKTVMFFSYKGGVGRSNCLCNVATSLCRKNFKVGIVDFDIEAPSIHLKFKESISKEVKMDQLTPDILTLLRSNLDELTPQIIKESTISIITPWPDVKCSFIPCLGRNDDVEALEAKWAEKISTLEKIFEMYGHNEHLDYLLVDARSGYSQAMILVALTCDDVIAISRADEISKYGLKNMIEIFEKRAKDIYLLISLVPQRYSQKHPKIQSFIKYLDFKGKFHILSYNEDWYFGDDVIWESNNKNEKFIKSFDQLASDLTS